MYWWDKLLLLLTGLVALYMIFRLSKAGEKLNKGAVAFYMLAFIVLLVAGVLLILLGYGILGSPLVVVVTTLIPLGLATGLVYDVKPEWSTGYLWFAIIGFVLIALGKLVPGLEGLGRVVLPIVHGIFGLTIVVMPYMAVSKGMAPGDFVWVAIGGILISLGGMALAFLKAGKQLLFFSEAVVLAILAPLLFVMALAYAWGLMKRLVAG